MHRTDAEGNVNGQFHPGNPAIGQAATRIDADWLNAVQNNIIGVIEGANIALVKGDNSQLYDAIIALVAGVVGDGSGAVPTTRQITGGGLLAGQGGTLAADRVFNLIAATVGEVAAQLRNDVVATPASLAGLVGRTTVGGGWVINIGPTIVQLFSGVAAANGTTVLSLPQAFPTQCRFAVSSGGSNLSNAQDNDPVVSGKGLTTVSVFSARDEATSVDVLAWGY